VRTRKGSAQCHLAALATGAAISAPDKYTLMIDAFKAGIPGSDKPFPDGAKMAKVHWTAKKNEAQPGQPFVPGSQHDIDFRAKDSKRFSDSGGWGYAVFEYDASSDTFRPGNLTDKPPQ
jgi:hypothetical protein